MTAYKHYSFDLWLTLIRSNPAFKQERVKYFYERWNSACKPIADVGDALRQVDVLSNALNEKTGGSITAEAMYLMAISRINNDLIDFSVIDTDLILRDMEELLLLHMPLVYCSNTAGVLQTLRGRGNCTISLLSNTGYTRGATLRKVLAILQLDDYFDFQLYSDEAGMSKPNKLFFSAMIAQATALHPAIGLHEIIHVGDNPLADAGGAHAMGVNSLLINANNNCINTILN